MSDWKHRLKDTLEPILSQPDPRPRLSAYHNMPCAIFRYPPEAELDLRPELTLLATRLSQRGKRVTVISLAECLKAALDAQLPMEQLIEAERNVGTATAVETINQILSEYQPLDGLVLARFPAEPDPNRDVVFIVRAGALFPVYRTSSLLEQLMGKVTVPTVLFYPGELDGAVGLKFMGVLDAEHNYRPKIF